MKRLAFFADGTWNRLEPKGGTNVAKLYNATLPSDTQLRRYEAGVGTGTWDRYLGGVFGLGISKNIKDGYRFLLDHWEEGDEIFLFGFSRGAYTVRSLSGWLHLAGLLRTDRAQLVDRAYDLYRDWRIPTRRRNSRWTTAAPCASRCSACGTPSANSASSRTGSTSISIRSRTSSTTPS